MHDILLTLQSETETSVPTSSPPPPPPPPPILNYNLDFIDKMSDSCALRTCESLQTNKRDLLPYRKFAPPISYLAVNVLLLPTGTRIPDPPFSSFGPSRDYGIYIYIYK